MSLKTARIAQQLLDDISAATSPGRLSPQEALDVFQEIIENLTIQSEGLEADIAKETSD